MPALLISIFTAISGWLVTAGTSILSIISTIGLSFVAVKLLMLFLFGAVLPVVLYNLISYYMIDVLSWAMSFAVSFFPSGVLETTIQLTGFGGYIADKLNLVAAVSITISASIARFIMDMVPFMGGK